MKKACYSICIFFTAFLIFLFGLLFYDLHLIRTDLASLRSGSPISSDTLNTSGSAEKVTTDPDDDYSYLVRLEDGYLCVYQNKDPHLYEKISISTKYIPGQTVWELKKGKKIQNEEELLGILESYTS